MSKKYWSPPMGLILAGASSLLLLACGGSDDEIPAPSVEVLSSKAEYVSGGDVLVAIKKQQAGAGTLSAKLNGVDVAAAFKPDPADSSRLLGVVSGLVDGANTLSADFGGAATKVTLTNYPITGPMLSGPHLKPYICQTEAFTLPDGSKLGVATDANCSAATKVNYVYRATTGGALKPLPSTSSLPADVATTTNTLGVTVPFVVRVETGTMNRGIYQNAVLHDPTSDTTPTPLSPPKGWNKRLIANHGSGCTGGWYVQGAAMGVSPLTGDNLTRLGEGYAVFINTLNHPTNSCNATLAGESTMMGKEHFIKTFGVPYYTVSTGGSGGAYTSLQVADAYPGLFDGVLVNSTFPDAMSISMSSLDAKLLSRYYNAANTGAFTEDQMVTVSGHKNARAWYDLALQSGRTDPITGRVDPTPASPNPFVGGYKAGVWSAAVPTALRYDPSTNPTGARATVFDVGRNIFGIDAATGFALRPYDNVGVQYGLAALKAGKITPAQFVDLNEKVGGYDQDGNYVTARAVGDAGAIKRSYQSGIQLHGGGGLASIPVVDIGGIYDDDQFYHYQWFHFAVRERMAAANGSTGNHVMWRGAGPITELLGSPTAVGTAINQAANTQSWAMFIQWMDAYKADTSGSTQRDKVIARKPANAVDGCFTKSLTPQFIAEAQTLSSQASTQCNTLYPSWTAPRIEAGGPVSAQNLKCQFKLLARADYTATFTDAEWARLQATFPYGVCDWSKPGVNQTAAVPYASFGPSTINQVFDISKP
jgi:hypothetical protein